MTGSDGLLLTSTVWLFWGLWLGYLGLHWYLYARQETSLRAHYHAVPAEFSESLRLSEHQKAADYGLAKLRLARVELIIEGLSIAFWVSIGLKSLSAWLAPPSDASLLPALELILVVVATGMVMEWPLAFYRTFKLEARFGFNQSSVGLFIKDQLLTLLLSAILGVPLLWFVLWAITALGHHWWWVAFVGFASFSLTLSLVWPSFIAPLFNRFKALDDPELLSAVNELLTRVGFTTQGVYVMDGSRRSTHGNAYFTGFGQSKRIVLFDTLIARLSVAEIRAVLAHELGHFKLNHIKRQLAFSLVYMGLGFAAIGWVSAHPELLAPLNVPPNPASLLVFCGLSLSIFTWPIQPLMHQLTRAHEYQADAFAARYAKAVDLGQALKKLVRDNASTLTPDVWYSRFFASHPSLSERLRALKL
jgi:STE24 endopeptidase